MGGWAFLDVLKQELKVELGIEVEEDAFADEECGSTRGTVSDVPLFAKFMDADSTALETWTKQKVWEEYTQHLDGMSDEQRSRQRGDHTTEKDSYQLRWKHGRVVVMFSPPWGVANSANPNASSKTRAHDTKVPDAKVGAVWMDGWL